VDLMSGGRLSQSRLPAAVKAQSPTVTSHILCSDKIFFTLENIQLQQINKQMTVMYSEDVPSYAFVTHWTV